MRSRRWFRPKSEFEREMTEELRFHLEKQIAANIANGIAPEEARRLARLQLGAMEGVKENCREQRRGFWLESLWTDIHYGFRMLRKNPGFTAIVIITLAFGIGANTAIFTVVNSILLRQLPVRNPGQITDLAWKQKGGRPLEYFSYPDYKDIREQSSSVFSNVAVFETSFDGLSSKGRADRILTSYVTGNYFEMLGVKPAEGRLIRPSDGQPLAPDSVIVLSYAYWRTHFGADKRIVGKTVAIDGKPTEVVGIAPRGFHGTMPFVETQGYLPLSISGDQTTNRALRNLHVMARLAPGVTIANADSTLRVIAQRLALEDPKDDKDMAITAYPEAAAQLGPTMGGPLKISSALFLGLAALVLLLACVNVANLLLARATARRREMALRAALGGTRTRLVRQLLTESLLLALCGGVAGIFVGVWSAAALSSIQLKTGIPLVLDFTFDWRVFLYAFAATILAGIVVGIVPALRASRANIDWALHESGISIAPGPQRMRSLLVVGQVAGSLILLVIAGLFLRSLNRAQRLDLGFDPNHLLNLSMDPHELGYNETQSREFYHRLLQRVRAMPGVESAALAFTIPMRPYTSSAGQLKMQGYRPPAGQPAPTVFFNMVSPNYFSTIRTPIIRGREFTRADDKDAPRVAVVNRRMAEQFWHGEDAIGRTFQLTAMPNAPIRVVGVAKDSKTLQLSGPAFPYFYVPLAQTFMSYQTLQVRTARGSATMIPGIERLIASMAPGLPVFDVETMQESLRAGPLLAFQFGAVLAAALGILGLILALVGVYGVTSYAAAQRTHEIGIRLALGARPSEIMRMMLRQGALVVVIGLALGLAVELSAGRVVGRFLIVSGADPLTTVTVSVALAIVALAACWIPARRATGVDPVVALRHE